ncbi:hypothetical protein ATK74_1772 [Propionicimonas paludicola]|uniref:Uncharacterized protein n=1 Tax=Propionicimonas paludicola TaxID=185243 RepID=A0A2A9CUH4_9ACTN|nr:hypothetical protein [Propionicimonas paludicola]PFG17209.1 hypothetical protein ATK74_1772 [Propionicimonas paludicola]
MTPQARVLALAMAALYVALLRLMDGRYGTNAVYTLTTTIYLRKVAS